MKSMRELFLLIALLFISTSFKHQNLETTNDDGVIIESEIFDDNLIVRQEVVKDTGILVSDSLVHYVPEQLNYGDEIRLEDDIKQTLRLFFSFQIKIDTMIGDTIKVTDIILRSLNYNVRKFSISQVKIEWYKKEIVLALKQRIFVRTRKGELRNEDLYQCGVAIVFPKKKQY